MSQLVLVAATEPLLIGLVILAIFIAMMFLGTIILLKTNYKRCSSNQVLVIFGKHDQGPGGQDGPRRGRVRRGRCFRTTAT